MGAANRAIGIIPCNFYICVGVVKPYNLTIFIIACSEYRLSVDKPWCRLVCIFIKNVYIRLFIINKLYGNFNSLIFIRQSNRLGLSRKHKPLCNILFKRFFIDCSNCRCIGCFQIPLSHEFKLLMFHDTYIWQIRIFRIDTERLYSTFCLIEICQLCIYISVGIRHKECRQFRKFAFFFGCFGIFCFQFRFPQSLRFRFIIGSAC